MTDIRKGGCLCGKTRYEVAGDPLGVFVCHCRDCQRASGSAFQPVAFFRAEQCKVTGATQDYARETGRGDDRVTTRSCPICPTGLLAQPGRFAQIVGVLTGTLDDPGTIPFSGDLVRHIFLRSACAGTILPADVDLYAGPAMDADDAPLPSVRLRAPFAITEPGRLPPGLA